MRPRTWPALALLVAVVAPLLGARLAWSATPALVFEPDTGLVVHHDAIHQRWHPASLTKLMTLYVTFDALEAGRLGLTDTITVSARAAGRPPSRLGLEAGSTLTVNEAVIAVITASANDAAVALAERVEGAEEAFVARMMVTARALGMTRTVFRNVTGLPDPEHVSTAHDIALLVRRLIQDFPRRYRLFSTRAMTFEGRTRKTINRLLETYQGADGLKTGFTCAAGYNLAASARRDGRRLAGVVLGAGSGWQRVDRMSKLLDAGFAELRAGTSTLRLGDIPVSAEVAARAAPTRLSAEACAKLARRPMLRPGNLPGWGILLGVFSTREQARDAARKARARLRGVTGPGGLPVILEHKFERGSSWKVLLVGYELDGAGTACKRLWAERLTCVAQSPTLINHRQYALR